MGVRAEGRQKARRAAQRAVAAQVEAAYAARFRNDIDAALTLFEDDLRLRIEAHATRGALHGVMHGRAAFERQAAIWDWSSMTTEARVIDDAHIVVRSVGALRSLARREAALVRMIDLLTMADGRCVAIHALIDPALARRLFDIDAA